MGQLEALLGPSAAAYEPCWARLRSLGKPLEQGRGGALGFSAEEKGGRDGRRRAWRRKAEEGEDEEEEAGQ